MSEISGLFDGQNLVVSQLVLYLTEKSSKQHSLRYNEDLSDVGVQSLVLKLQTCVTFGLQESKLCKL